MNMRISPLLNNPMNTLQKIQPLKYKAGNVVQEEDKFELSATLPSFTANKKETDLHLPVEEIQNLFEKGYQEVQKYDNIKDRVKVLGQVNNSLRENYLNAPDDTYFINDRNHEVGNAMAMSLIYADYDANRGRLSEERFNEMYKLAQKRIINIIKRYEFFLDKGLNENKLSPKELFDMAFDPLKEAAKDKNIKIKISGKDVLDTYTVSLHEANPLNKDYQIYTVFSNIMQNAIKYSPENSLIKVDFRVKEIKGKTHLEFSVSDEGIGIPPEEQSAARDGRRATNAVQSGIQGTGYGLRRVDRCMKEMSGELEVISPLNYDNINYPGTKISCYFELEYPFIEIS